MTTTITLIDGDRQVVLAGARTPGAEGVWEFDNLDGWRGHAPNKSQSRERPQGHGAFRNRRVLRSARAIAFVARFVSSDEAASQHAFDAFGALGADSDVLMVVAEASGTTARWVTIERSSPTAQRSRINSGFDVELTAVDPRRYSLADGAAWVSTPPMSEGTGLVWPVVWPAVWPGGGSSGRIVLSNAGEASSSPVFRLWGGFESALITCTETGARIGLDRYVAPDSFVEIDTAEHRATIDGQADVSRWLLYREWETVPPNGSRTFQFDPAGQTGTPMLEGRVLSAWW